MAQLRELNSAQANLRVQPAPYTVPQGDLAQQLIAAAKRDRTEAANLAEAEAFERNLRAETERKRDEVAKELDAASAAIADAEAAIEADKAELRRLLTEFEAHTEGLKACYQALLALEQRGNIDRSDLVMWVYPLKWPRVMPPKGGINGATTYIDDAMGWYTQP
jgi:chromosome segregation ATPase